MDDKKAALEPSVTNPSKAERMRLKKGRINHIDVNVRYASGRMHATSIGGTMGTWVIYEELRVIRKAILLVSVVSIGITPYWLGVTPGRRRIFMGRNGKLWRVPGKTLPARAADPRKLDRESKRVWAATMEDHILEQLSPVEEVNAVIRTGKRYRSAVKALVQRRVDEAAEYGRDYDAEHFAKACCEAWGQWDLLAPRRPSIQHALYTSLVLSLPADMAAELIELAAMMEFRLPILSRWAAKDVYENAVRQLAAMCPAWHAEGWSLEWEHYGSIDLYLRRQFARMLTDAEHLEVDLGAAAGKLRDILPEAAPQGDP